MELRVFRLLCYVTCILCRNAVDGSTLAKVFPSINNTSQPDVKMSEIGSTRARIEHKTQSIETETRADGITLKDDSSKPETLRESPLVQDLSTKTKILNDSEKAKCYRYCIQQLGTGKGFEDINFVWSFADQNEEERERDYFSLENNPKLKILKHVLTHNKSSTILDYCQIYLNLDCDMVNMERNLIIENDEFYSNSKFNLQNVEIFKSYFTNTIPKFSKKLVHKTNLRGYTETNFQTDANVTGIVIDILGNFTRGARAILAIPINRTVEKLEIVMSLTSTHNTKGVAIGARTLPGKWCVKLSEVENSKYNLDVIAYYGGNKENNARDDLIDTSLAHTSEINRRKDFDEILGKKYKANTQSKASIIYIINKTKFMNESEQERGKTRENTANNSTNLFLITPTINRKQKFVFERSAEIMDPRRNNDEIYIMADNFSERERYISLSSRESTAAENIMNYFNLHNNSLMSYGELKMLPNASNIKEQQQKIQARSSEVASLNEDIDTKIKSSIGETAPMQMTNSDQSQQFSTQINEDPYEKRRILLEVNANSKLIAAPGTTHRVIFDATNNCVLPVRYAIRARSSPFRIYNIQPTYMWLYPGQTDQVAVDILVPLGSQDTVNTLTLLIAGTEISEKTIYVYVQNDFSKNIDNVKPTIEYSFNSNCNGKLDKDRCEKTLWSADITVQDYDSGLKRVISIPNRIYPRTKYIAGTKDRVTFYYSSTCCTTTATITAIDVFENQYTRTIDVTTWDNLSQGEIAAIILGVLFLLFLLILIIVAIVYCVRKKSSHDLPYTQRYGSRQPPRSERTSF